MIAGIQLAGSQPGTQSGSRLRITESISELLDESSSAIDEDVTLRPDVASSPVRALVHGHSSADASLLGAQSTSRPPIVGRRAGTLNSTSNATTAGPASLTVSNLSRHTHRSSHESFERPQQAISQYSEGLQPHGQYTTEVVRASTEGQRRVWCDCTDGCRSSKCPCAASGRLCSRSCTGHRLCCNAPFIMENVGLGDYYFGSVQPQIEFHDCFTSRLEAVASGELSMQKLQDMSCQFPCGLVAGRELTLMKLLPVGMEDQAGFTFRRGIPDEVRTPAENRNVQLLFRLALSKEPVNGHTFSWKFSFCENRWINFADWVHCVKCGRCHGTLNAPRGCR